MGEIDHPERAKNQRQAQGNQRVNGAELQPGQALQDKGVHETSCDLRAGRASGRGLIGTEIARPDHGGIVARLLARHLLHNIQQVIGIRCGAGDLLAVHHKDIVERLVIGATVSPGPPGPMPSKVESSRALMTSGG